MKIEEAIFSHLSADAGVSSIVSARIFPVVLPQDVQYPALSYLKFDGRRHASHNGDSRLMKDGFQVSCWSETYSAVKILKAAVVSALQGFKGTMGGGGGVPVGHVLHTSEVDIFRDEVLEDGLFHVALRFSVMHKEA